MRSTPTRQASRRLVTFRPRDTLDRAFEIGVVLKGIDGLLELLGGLALLLITPATIERLAAQLTGSVLGAAMPDDVASQLLLDTAKLTADGLAFGAGYLLVHGIVKVFLVVALLRNKLWAYPWMIVVLLGFVGFQGYRLVVAPSLGLVALSIFDLAVIALTWRAFGRQRRGRHARNAREATSAPSQAQLSVSASS